MTINWYELLESLRFVWDVIAFAAGGFAATSALAWVIFGFWLKNNTLESIPVQDLLSAYSQIEPITIIIGLMCGLIYCAYFKGIKEWRRRDEILKGLSAPGLAKLNNKE